MTTTSTSEHATDAEVETVGRVPSAKPFNILYEFIANNAHVSASSDARDR